MIVYSYMYLLEDTWCCVSGECRKGGMCPPAQSAKLKIIYGLKVSKIANLDIFFQSYTYSVYGW